MEVTKLEIVVAGRDFGIDHDNTVRRAIAKGVDCGLHRERRRRAGNIHVIAPTFGTESILNLDCDRRVGTLQVGTPDDDCIDISVDASSLSQSVADGGQRHLGLDTKLVFGARFKPRPHPVRIKHASFFHHIPRFDTRCLHDELLVGHRPLHQGSRGNLISVLSVPLLDGCSQRGAQLRVAN